MAFIGAPRVTGMFKVCMLECVGMVARTVIGSTTSAAIHAARRGGMSDSQEAAVGKQTTWFI